MNFYLTTKKAITVSSLLITFMCPNKLIANTLKKTNINPQETLAYKFSNSESSTIKNKPIKSGLYSLEHKGILRNFRMFVPADYNSAKSHKLIMMFHGWGQDENEFFDTPIVEQLAQKRDYILVAPRGLSDDDEKNSDSWNSRNSWSFRGSTTGLNKNGEKICDDSVTENYNYHSCDNKAGNINSCAWTHCLQNDVEFVLALIDHVSAYLNIDTNNIFATGGSNGGMFTWELGQNSKSAPRLRAIAPLIGLPHRGYNVGKGKKNKLPALLLTGKDDQTVPPGDLGKEGFSTTTDGDKYYYVTATSIIKTWSKDNGCNISGDEVIFKSLGDGTNCFTYCTENIGWPLVLDCRANTEHTFDLNWSWELILDFFDAHAKEQS